jgi:AcrR family transcriptional regulator
MLDFMARKLDDTGKAILDAADRVLAVDGPEALTVRRIATEAGLSTMGVYSRFGGKEGVVDQLRIDGFQILIETMELTPTTDQPLDDLRGCGRNYRKFALAHPTHYLVMFGSALTDCEMSDDAGNAGHSAFAQLVERIHRGQSLGVIRADVDDAAIAEVVWSTLHGHMVLELRQRHAMSGVENAERYELVLDQIVRGWAPDPAP